MKYQFTPIYDKISSDTDSYHKQIRKLKKEKADELLKELNYREAKTLRARGTNRFIKGGIIGTFIGVVIAGVLISK